MPRSAAAVESFWFLYLKNYVLRAEELIYGHIIQMISPGDCLLIVSCSHLVIGALICAAKTMGEGCFSVILTQVNDPTAV